MSTDLIHETAAALASERGGAVHVEERTIRIADPVKGDAGLTVLRVLGQAQDAAPVGAAAHGDSGVAIGVWRNPELFVARWTKGRRWVVGYRIPGNSKPNAFIRTEGRIPTRLETGNWYGAIPDEVGEAFFEVGLLIDDPPFPIPPAPVAPPPRPAAASAARKASSRPTTPRTPRATKPARPAPGPTTRVCPSCGMQKGLTQFIPGSDLCVDCR